MVFTKFECILCNISQRGYGYTFVSYLYIIIYVCVIINDPLMPFHLYRNKRPIFNNAKNDLYKILVCRRWLIDHTHTLSMNIIASAWILFAFPGVFCLRFVSLQNCVYVGSESNDRTNVKKVTPQNDSVSSKCVRKVYPIA